ncbi:MAG: PaaI family thioesterase [Thermoleophilaceae bacterium]
MSAGAPESPKLSTTFDQTLGFEVGEIGDELVTGSFPVADAVRQPFGIVHGGAYAGMAEMLASVATYVNVQADGQIAVGLSNDTNFLRPVSEGTVRAEGRRRHRGRTTWIWDVEFRDERDRVCALSRVTIAVRPAPAGRPPARAGGSGS